MRNPWRASFDPETGDLYVGDVGQDAREEIDVIPNLVGGLNLGWRLREGTIATPGVGGPRPAGAVDPIFDYTHSGGALNGCSVVGGVVYRGPIDELDGRYFFSDYCTTPLVSLRFNGDPPVQHDGTNFTDFQIHDDDPAFVPNEGTFESLSSFGVDGRGNLYIVKLGARDGFAVLANTGEIFRVPEPERWALQLAALAMLTATAGFRRRADR